MPGPSGCRTLRWVNHRDSATQDLHGVPSHSKPPIWMRRHICTKSSMPSFVKKTWFGSPSSSNVKKGPTKSHMARGSSPLPLKDSTPQIRGNDAAVTSASKRRRIHQEGREASSSKPRRCAADAHARTPRGILGRRGVAAAVRFMGAARFVHAGRPGDGAAPPPPPCPGRQHADSKTLVAEMATGSCAVWQSWGGISCSAHTHHAHAGAHEGLGTTLALATLSRVTKLSGCIRTHAYTRTHYNIHTSLSIYIHLDT